MINILKNIKNLYRVYDKTLIVYFIKHLFNRSWPPYGLIFYVTNKCNSRCIMCFNWKILNKDLQNEMTLDEIDQFTKKIGKLKSVGLGGGEPSLRSDLPEIVNLFVKNNKASVVFIAFNSLLPNKTAEQVEAIFEKSPNVSLKIGLSLDGVGSIHDKVRGVEGNFEKFLQTYKKLEDLKKKYPRLRTRICTTVLNQNIDNIEELIEYVRENFKSSFHGLELVKGSVPQADTKGLDLSKYEKIIKSIKESEKNSNNIYRRIINPLYQKVCVYILKNKKQVVPCRMSNFMPVIDAQGNIYPCEGRGKIGNLRESDYDLKKVWQSSNSKNERKKIKKEKCFCTHSVYQIPNIYMSPKMLIKIIFSK
ncbi:MAG: radical SAM protein [Patescibacteria group bacterium]